MLFGSGRVTGQPVFAFKKIEFELGIFRVGSARVRKF